MKRAGILAGSMGTYIFKKFNGLDSWADKFSISTGNPSFFLWGNLTCTTFTSASAPTGAAAERSIRLAT